MTTNLMFMYAIVFVEILAVVLILIGVKYKVVSIEFNNPFSKNGKKVKHTKETKLVLALLMVINVIIFFSI